MENSQIPYAGGKFRGVFLISRFLCVAHEKLEPVEASYAHAR